VIDYHVHLWPHDERGEPAELMLDRLARYCEQARENGVEEIALTEHLFRFRAFDAIARRFWDAEPNEGLRRSMDGYFAHHATEDLDHYVERVLLAKDAGLPIVLGLEVDYYPGRMEEVGGLLAGYPFDVLLGSVHWLGSWLFDALEDDAAMAEWDSHRTEDVWRRYTDALAELADSKSVDVLAHPDLIKLTGRVVDPGVVRECEARIADAAKTCGLAAEISSAGWRKPIGEAYPSPSLLDAFFANGVPVTLASDSHGPHLVGARADELAAFARSVGYGSLRAFRARVARDVPIGLAQTSLRG
jgi:histidinol-phosphatase (PHP family)